MAHYTGIDMIEIPRIRKALARWGEVFLSRIYTEAEIQRYRAKPSSLAARFACKEAVMKLLGTGRRGVRWREIETLSRPGGRPVVRLYGRAKDKAEALGVTEINVSLSHSKEYAIASVIGSTEVEGA
jgi:holo-[acyl-carrier protein] synthase